MPTKGRRLLVRLYLVHNRLHRWIVYMYVFRWERMSTKQLKGTYEKEPTWWVSCLSWGRPQWHWHYSRQRCWLHKWIPVSNFNANDHAEIFIKCALSLSGTIGIKKLSIEATITKKKGRYSNSPNVLCCQVEKKQKFFLIKKYIYLFSPHLVIGTASQFEVFVLDQYSQYFPVTFRYSYM